MDVGMGGGAEGVLGMGGNLGMTMHDEQPAIWSASAGASL